jgi:hypothetical protein
VVPVQETQRVVFTEEIVQNEKYFFCRGFVFIK